MEEIEPKFSKLLAPSRHELVVRLLNLHNHLLMAQSTTMNTVNIPNDQMIQSDQEPGAMMIEEGSQPMMSMLEKDTMRI